MVCFQGTATTTLRIRGPSFILELPQHRPTEAMYHFPLCSGKEVPEDLEWEEISAELLSEDEDDGLNDGDWLPDRERARQKREQARIFATRVEAESHNKKEQLDSSATNRNLDASPASPYTDDEEELISAMGGKTRHLKRKREPGFLGDCTLQEISIDYSVPICYIADVLCMWGVPIPINIDDRLGDLVTGEQAFALLEAVNSLDVAQLHDRYSNTSLLTLCYEWDIDLQKAFEMAMKEGWSLPFGVQTCLRVEQESELLRVLGGQTFETDEFEEVL